MIYVRQLIWDPWNVPHIARHGITPEEAEEVCHGESMFQRGFFAHVDLDGATPFDRMRRGGVRFSGAGENLALAPTVEVAHEGLMNSPGHRANILNARFRRIGIGAASGGMHGRMFTQNFAD